MPCGLRRSPGEVVSMHEAVFARCLIQRFRIRALQEREAVSGFWTNLADATERKLLKNMGWKR